MRQVRSRSALARAATSPVLLGASHARRALPGCAFVEVWFVFVAKINAPASRQAVPGGGDLWGGEERRFGVGARSALRDLICRILFERNERSE
jgi:hypothetical protein